MKKLTKEFSETSSTRRILAQKTVWMTASAIPVVAFAIIVALNFTDVVTTIEQHFVQQWVLRATEIAFSCCVIMVVKRTDSAHSNEKTPEVDITTSTASPASNVVSASSL